MAKNRRAFLRSTSIAAAAALVPKIPGFRSAADSASTFEWQAGGLQFHFEVASGKLRQHGLLPVGTTLKQADFSAGVEVALQCSGENSPDQGMKSGMGQPGMRLEFVAKTAYLDFLTLWKDADADIPILRQATAEYARLQ